MLFMDLRKALDTVSHEILLQKLHHSGIRGTANDLTKSYLSPRQQYVTFNQVCSFLNPISIGVPQSSILSPLFFIIYVNDLSNATTSNLRLYADDTCQILSNTSPSDVEAVCNSELKNLHNWCNANMLQINPQKQNILISPYKLNSPSLDLNYTSIILSFHVKILANI